MQHIPNDLLLVMKLVKYKYHYTFSFLAKNIFFWNKAVLKDKLTSGQTIATVSRKKGRNKRGRAKI